MKYSYRTFWIQARDLYILCDLQFDVRMYEKNCVFICISTDANGADYRMSLLL